MTDTDGNLTTRQLISTENVCGLIIDTACVGGIANALDGNETAKASFGDGNVVELNMPADIKESGLDKNIMAGIPYYHVSNFFTLAGSNQRLFVSFMDSSVDTEFEAIERMQLAANGIIYQIGIWTSQPFATVSGSSVNIIDNGLLTKLETQAELLGGKVGVTNFEGNSPLNVIVTAPVAASAQIDYSKLPDINSLNLPKVSVLIGQAANDEIHDMQLAINVKAGNKTGHITVGNIGAALACFAVAPVEESIAHVRNFNLSSVMTTAELGFGNTTIEGEGGSEKFVDNASFTNIKTLNYTKRNTKLHQLGYIFLTTHSGIENGVFFSSDQTLTSGDYRTIARCRTIHKARRVVRLALLPYVNEAVEVDASTGQLSNAMITEYQNTVYDALDNNMVDPGSRSSQISGRQCTINPEQNILENDQLLIDFRIVPMGCTSAIFVTEGFTATVSEQ